MLEVAFNSKCHNLEVDIAYGIWLCELMWYMVCIDAYEFHMVEVLAWHKLYGLYDFV
jgi:hypothetical protein